MGKYATNPNKALTKERLMEVMAFDPATGVFTWIKSRHRIRLGKRAGIVKRSTGFRVVTIDGEEYYAHALAWFWTHGVWPPLIRFKNADRDDCRINNLVEGRRLETKYDCH